MVRNDVMLGGHLFMHGHSIGDSACTPLANMHNLGANNTLVVKLSRCKEVVIGSILARSEDMDPFCAFLETYQR